MIEPRRISRMGWLGYAPPSADRDDIPNSGLTYAETHGQVDAALTTGIGCSNCEYVLAAQAGIAVPLSVGDAPAFNGVAHVLPMCAEFQVLGPDAGRIVAAVAYVCRGGRTVGEFIRESVGAYPLLGTQDKLAVPLSIAGAGPQPALSALIYQPPETLFGRRRRPPICPGKTVLASAVHAVNYTAFGRRSVYA
jgi:hypothetical protein